MSKGRSYKLKIDGDGMVEGYVRYRGDPITLEAPHAIEFHKWSHVELAFTGKRAALLINGREERVWTWKPPKNEPDAEPPEIRVDSNHSLKIGLKGAGFIGRIDHVMVSDFSEDERFYVPKGVQFFADGTTTTMIRFLPSGALDPREHLRPETITLKSTIAGTLESLRIGLMGDVR